MAYVSVPAVVRRNPFGDSDTSQVGLGLAPLAIAATVGGLFHGSSKNKDLAEVDRRYAAAIAGNPILFPGQTALQSLLSGAGKDPTHPGGFATAEGRAYSYQKYQAAVALGVSGTNSFGDAGVIRPPGSPPTDLLSSVAGGSNLTTLALIGLGAFVLSKVVK